MLLKTLTVHRTASMTKKDQALAIHCEETVKPCLKEMAPPEKTLSRRQKEVF